MLFSTQQHRDNAVIPNRDGSVDRTAVIALCGALEFRCDMNGQAADRSMRCPPPQIHSSHLFIHLHLVPCSFLFVLPNLLVFLKPDTFWFPPLTHKPLRLRTPAIRTPPPPEAKGELQENHQNSTAGGSLCVCSCACICQSRELLRLTKSISPGCTSVTHNS